MKHSARSAKRRSAASAWQWESPQCCRSASAQAAEDTRSAAESRLEEIIVTGSLITDPNRESSSPIVISTIESLQQSGTVTLEAALNQMPQFAPVGQRRQRRAGHRRPRHRQPARPRRESQSRAARRPAAAARGHLRHRRHQPGAGLDPVERADDHRRRLGRLRLGRDVRRRQLHLARSFRRRELRCAVRQHRARRSLADQGVARTRHDVRGGRRPRLAVGRLHRSRQAARQGPDAVLRSADAVLVHRPGHVRAVGDEPAEPDRRSTTCSRATAPPRRWRTR